MNQYNYQPFPVQEPTEKEEKKDFLYSLKFRTAIIGFILYLLLSSNIAFKILHLIISSILNNHFEIINEKNKPTFLAKLFMAFIIFIILFIF
jgi:hypothetical protein